ncbi:50S ribosomal protein L23 [Vicingaceae bacterium]|jgi:large subunit ribosomal protein L23|nr:50S ribosomal protein L23 [Vicingaceae bacterium]
MSIIVKPVITEKMTNLTESLGRYGFIVDKTANKIQIKEAVEKAYGVAVKEVNTMNIFGKKKTKYTRTGWVEGRTNSTKKAIVTLESGDTIDFYSNI